MCRIRLDYVTRCLIICWFANQVLVIDFLRLFANLQRMLCMVLSYQFYNTPVLTRKTLTLYSLNLY